MISVRHGNDFKHQSLYSIIRKTFFGMFLGFLTMHFTCHFDNTLTHMLIRTQPCTVHMSAGIKLNLKAIDDVKGENVTSTREK